MRFRFRRHYQLLLLRQLNRLGTSPDGAQGVTLIALALGVFIAVEYAAPSPGLVGFRDAPPFNRLRLGALFATLFLLSLIAVAQFGQGSSLALVVSAFGVVIAALLDVPLSPLQAMAAQVPEGLDPVHAVKIEAMTGLAFLVLLVATAAFALVVRLGQWPSRDCAFNVWVNLPTFDPNGGADVVKRLRRAAVLNMILGVAAPFALPGFAVSFATLVGIDGLGAPHTLVWGITLWMFVPLSLLMRGIALARIASMIGRRRESLMTAALASDAASAPALSR